MANTKIKPEHFAQLRAGILALVNDKPEAVRLHHEAIKADVRVKDVALRFRWDLLNAAKLTELLCREIYGYANDAHVDTALRAIMREVQL
jgi:hypothetical protein